jgi:hypothetical protein
MRNMMKKRKKRMAILMVFGMGVMLIHQIVQRMRIMHLTVTIEYLLRKRLILSKLTSKQKKRL